MSETVHRLEATTAGRWRMELREVAQRTTQHESSALVIRAQTRVLAPVQLRADQFPISKPRG